MSAHPKISKDSKDDVNACNPGKITETWNTRTGEDLNRAKSPRSRCIRLCFDIHMAAQVQIAPRPCFIEGIVTCGAKEDVNVTCATSIATCTFDPKTCICTTELVLGRDV